jgi:hypothetical protein
MKATHRSAQGKMVDMQALISRNEKVRAVGINQKVNARGDTIDDTGKIIVPVTEKVGKRYQGSVTNRSAVPKKQLKEQVKEQMTQEEMELEYLNELDSEIEKIKKQERK